MPNHRNIITWRKMWLCYFTLSIVPLDQPSGAVSTKLAVYNSKNSKPNRLASPFGQKKLSYVSELFLEASIEPAQWLDPPLVAVLAKILITTKKSLLVELLPRVVTVSPLFLLWHVLLFPLLHLLSLCLLLLAPLTPPWLGIWKMISSRLSKLSLGPDLFLPLLLHLFRLPLLPPLRIMNAHMSSLWKLNSRKFIRVKLT